MFIVFEGIDGCGKTTQILKLVDYLHKKDKHSHIILTREPYKQKEIREILKSNNNPYSEKEKLTELYINDRKKHIEELIKPALEKNFIVISNRYKYSTICYQSAQGQEMKKELNNLLEQHKNMLIPDFVFIIDTPTEIAIKRMAAEGINVSCTEMALFELLKTAEHPQFKQIAKLIK